MLAPARTGGIVWDASFWMRLSKAGSAVPALRFALAISIEVTRLVVFNRNRLCVIYSVFCSALRSPLKG